MRKFTREVKGSISLFLSMIILLLVILEGFLIDGSRILAGKAFMSTAGDMALNAGLTYYDEALHDIYGLFATCKTEEELTDALIEHFQVTLGETTNTTGDDEYTQQLLDYVKQSAMVGWNGEEAGKLLNMSLEQGSFRAAGVEGSTLSEGQVIKNQILEYMKYRGPASLGYGMIEKIYAFKDLDKQQKTMENKLEFEETMSDVQDACEDAYTNIEQYNKLLEGDMKPSKLESDSQTINRNIWEAIIATWCFSVAKRDSGIDTNWKRKTDASGTDVFAAANACRLSASMSALYEQVMGWLQSDFADHPRATMTAVKILLGYSEDYENYRNLYTVWENYEDDYEERMDALQEALDNLDEDEEGDDIEAEIEALEEEYEENYEKYSACETAIDEFKTVMTSVQSTLQEDINQRMSTAVSLINEIVKDAGRLILLSDLGTSSLDDVITQMEQLKIKGDNWQSSINNLSDGEIKTSMQTDYNNKSKELDEQKIRDLQELLANGRAYGVTVQDAAKAVKAVTYTLHDGDKSNYAPYMKSKFEGTVYGNETLPYNGVSYSDFLPSMWVENANNTGALTDGSCTIYFVNPNKEKKLGLIPLLDLSTYTSMMDTAISTKDDEFYKYLERVCPKSEAEEEDASDAEDEKDKLFEKAQEVDFGPDESLPTLSSGEGGDGSPEFTETGTDADDEDISDNAKENTKESSDFISGVSSLLEKGRDKLYISEYATEMFSYYTVDKPKDDNGNAPAVKETLSGYPMTADNNSMYKAEVEYILWGNPSGDADVQYTLTTIFGIRFLLNSLYAFTGDPEIRQVSLALATSIAGWTGFGVPLVQSVIIIGFALAETSLDIQALKEGESVPIYKASSTWQIKPSAISKEAIGQAINEAGSAAKEFVYDKMDELTEETKEAFKTELTEFANDTVDNIVSTAMATVLNPVQERLIGLVNVVSESQNDITSQIQESLNDVEATVSGEPESISKTIKLKAIDTFRSRLLRNLANEIANVQNDAELTNAQITERIYEQIDECRSTLDTALRTSAEELVNQECELVNSALDSANEDLQKNTSEAFDKMLMRIDCGVSFADLSGVDVDGGKGRTSGAAALTMNYKEYLWLFIAVKSLQNENDMLERIGTLIEANLVNSNTAPSKDFKIDGAYTFIEIDAKANLETTFFSVPVPLQGGGEVVLGQDQYSIGYRSALGY